MKLVDISKHRLQRLRDSGWESLLGEVSSFCTAHAISISNMEEMFSSKERSQHMVQEITNLYHYHIDLLYTIVNMLL